MTPEERRERRRLRREKQREDNVKRAAKMHVARIKIDAKTAAALPELKQSVAGVQAWRRQPGKKKFTYTVKVSEHITHIKRFKGTKTLIRILA